MSRDNTMFVETINVPEVDIDRTRAYQLLKVPRPGMDLVPDGDGFREVAIEKNWISLSLL